MNEMSAAIDRLRFAARTLPGVLAGFAEAESEQRPSPERWTKKEVLGHMIGSASNNPSPGQSTSWGRRGRAWEARRGRRRANVMQKVNLAEKLALFSDQWKPKVVGELNGQQVKLVKFQGPFVWHHHDHEDELFLVVKGRFRMEFRDRQVWLEEGEFLIVPRGVEHRPVADEEAHVLLFEPASTLNTGNVQNERTVAHLDRI
jgi:mannose-6-phosphate isomerase-like protein (cupin superfamily)